MSSNPYRAKHSAFPIQRNQCLVSTKPNNYLFTILVKYLSGSGIIVKLKFRGVAQLGSAPLWGSGGRGFESRRSDFLKPFQLGVFARFVRSFQS